MKKFFIIIIASGYPLDQYLFQMQKYSKQICQCDIELNGKFLASRNSIKSTKSDGYLTYHDETIVSCESIPMDATNNKWTINFIILIKFS